MAADKNERKQVSTTANDETYENELQTIEDLSRTQRNGYEIRGSERVHNKQQVRQQRVLNHLSVASGIKDQFPDEQAGVKSMNQSRTYAKSTSSQHAFNQRRDLLRYETNNRNPPHEQPVANSRHQIDLDQAHHHQHHHHHHHRQHRFHSPSCQASKSILHSSSETPKLLKHQPHCIHHNPTCPKQQQPVQIVTNHDGEDQSIADRHYKPIRSRTSKQPDKSYLLVHYKHGHSALKRNVRDIETSRQPQSLIEDAPISQISNKRTTVKFISQLYFLLHLSAILSLLLHHKNLVSNERRFSRQWIYRDMIPQPDVLLYNSSDRRPLILRSVAPTTTTQAPLSNQLPVPLMAMPSEEVLLHANSQLIQSFVAKHPSPLQPTANFRLSRRATNVSGQTGIATGNSDMLVRLVGPWHARCALQYFLCYLLASSITILVCLRLFRLCGSHKKKACRYSASHSISIQQPSANSATSGFYYRTRLDCTPVLIGSISLGLIQLIVIGLDIANNIDWLSETRWPIYLPFLQFAFVSLLMQFILGRVAKNSINEENNIPSSTSSTRQLVDELSINKVGAKRGTSNNGEMVSALERASDSSSGLHNIALAHLLVTHILLWLMKLNSISLFQPVELKHHHHHHRYQQPAHFAPSDGHNFANTTAYQTLSHVETQSTAQPNNLSPRRDEQLLTFNGKQAQNNRAQLESMLRKKWPIVSATSETRAQEQNALTHYHGTLNVAGVINSTGGNNGSNVGGQLNRLTLESLPMRNGNETLVQEAPNKERSLRSTVHLNRASVSQLADQTTVAQTGMANSANDSLVTMSQAQLQNLLSLIALKKDKTTTVSPKLAHPGTLQPSNVNNVTENIFRSSLPKRMTAFRQTRPPSVPSDLLSSTKRPPTSSTTTTTTPTASTKPRKESVQLSQNPKQKARVLVTHGDEVTDSSKSGHDDPRGANRKLAINDSRQHFPSVDAASVGSMAADSQHKAVTHSRIITRQPTEVNLEEVNDGQDVYRSNRYKNDIEKESAVQGTSEEPEEDEGDNEETDIDLDLLLPPVPNYNETEEEETPKVGKTARALFKNETVEGKRGAFTKDEAFVFNEAASGNINITLAPPMERSNGSSRVDESAEALVSSASSTIELSADETSRASEQATFADYLLPIVHQYHILIIAILFNMWLDSLCVSPRMSQQQQQSIVVGGDLCISHARMRRNGLRGNRLLLQSSSSSSSSELEINSRSSSTKRLIAIPVHRHPDFKRSKSMDLVERDCESSSNSEINSLSRYNSLRSSTSEQLLWLPANQKLVPKSKRSTSSDCELPLSLIGRQRDCGKTSDRRRNKVEEEEETTRATERETMTTATPSNSVCSVFFGLLVVSSALIVILLGIDILSVLAQCFTQLISILVCLLGLCLISRWRIRQQQERRQWRNNHRRKLRPNREDMDNDSAIRQARLRRGTVVVGPLSSSSSSTQITTHGLRLESQRRANNHRQCFHYLFLLAAYYCGISIALNLGRQYSSQQLFTPSVIHFVQRLLTTTTRNNLHLDQPMANYLFLFHALLALKGTLLVVQVTLQTILIRASCQRASRDLRQLYTFLMFANLSLWALEICEQQQQPEAVLATTSEQAGKLISLDGFTRFAGSIVTLSHLYHGLVFMQH